MNCSVQPLSRASLMSVPIAVAGAAAQTMTYKTRPAHPDRASHDRSPGYSGLGGELLGFGAEARRSPG
jgi:hypothetical protein